jgi:hypothetical protein
MYRVKVKKACGGLKKKQEGGVSDEKTEINSSMGPVPREKANIEVEKGESAFGDINGDSFAELMFFGGKRHHSGGTPVNVPPGTFIFSDTAKMRIKDPELLEKFFNISNPKKKGYTPAEISKQYKGFNEYMDTLKDEDADDMKVATAYEMVGSITNKLGALALIQESMKGFPDGIPSFAESAVAALGIDPQQLAAQMAPEQPQQPTQGEMPQQGLPQISMGEMKLGGSLNKFLPKAENGGDPPKQNADSETQNADSEKKDPEWFDKNYKGQYKGQGFYGSIEDYEDFINDLGGVDKDGEGTSTGSTMTVDNVEYTLTRQDAQNIWKQYLEAWETGDPEKVKDVQDIFDSLDAPGIGMWAWGTQDKLQDLSGVLEERVDELKEQTLHQDKLKKAGISKDQYSNYLQLLKYKKHNLESLNPDDPNITKLKAEINAVENKLKKPLYELEKKAYTAGPLGATAIKEFHKFFDTDVLGGKDLTPRYKQLIDELNQMNPDLNIRYSRPDQSVSLNEENVIYFDDIKDWEELKVLPNDANTRQAVQPIRNNEAQSDSTATQSYDDYMNQFDFE